jgi:alcohol dehydrogenase YqhD (iron-dependent ADH family)
MVNFQYHNPAKIVFGPGTIEKLGSLLKDANATSLLMIYSGDFIKDLGIYASVAKTCKELNIDFYENGSVVPNPKARLVRELSELGKDKKVNFVLAVGGGSAIDTAKAVALGIPYTGDVWDFFDKGVLPEKVLPVGVISTIPASGSETSNCAILSNGEWKLGFEDDKIIPQFAIMDPKYTLKLPKYQTACGVADILSHLLERYFSDVPHTDVTDYLIEGAVKALLINGERVIKNPDDLDARSEISWLGSIAHNNLLDTGRIGDWGSHRIEHELSAQYGVTHGEGMAVVLVAWTRFAGAEKPYKLAQLASRIWGIDPYNYTESERADKLSSELERFFRLLGLKTKLGELGIDNKDFNIMADRATDKGTKTVGHYIPLDKAKFVSVLNLAL